MLLVSVQTIGFRFNLKNFKIQSFKYILKHAISGSIN